MLDGLPPVVQLLLREPPTDRQLGDLEQFRRYLKRLLPELKRQALWTIKHFDYPIDAADPRVKGFVIRPSTGLDPFSTFAKCADPRCRVLNAQQVARSIGLYGDTVMIADRFTTAILHTDKLTAGALFWIATLLRVLVTLKPMFESGVFQFYQSARSYCEHHRREFFMQIDEATEAVLEQTKDGIHFERSGNLVEIHSNKLHEPPLVMPAPLTKSDKAKLKNGVPLETVGILLAKEVFAEEVFESFLDLNNASNFRAVTFSNSRVSLLTAQYVERAVPLKEDIAVWEAARSAVLPWVRDLSVAQVLELRQEAANALPRLRAALGTAMSDQAADSPAVKEVVNRLQEEAAEVSAELKALKLPQKERDRVGLGLLGLTLSIYGIAGDIPLQAMAVSGLVTLLGLLHTTRRSDHQEHEKLTSKPGYVLVKAKELTEHAPK
jgi:hypothetical protein